MAPRNQPTANPSLRNRNRVTNKTRLKVIKENIDADPIVLDEDEERARVVSTAGVDAEDANEHHLQAVLSAASHRATALAQRAQLSNGARAEKPSSSTTPAAFIPVPDATGVAENIDGLYPPNKWRDTATYVKSSQTVEEATTNAINDGFSYFMDERDAEWLDKNNQEARGEGTSTQVSAAGATTRGSRSTKGKGKEVEVPSPVLMTEDEFELVMGLLEKVTHDNTPFLHLAFQQQQANSIPPFSDYHDIFANELSISHFAGYTRPPNLPSPPNLLRIAKTIYPYWRERKVDREGQRIIPALNFDESDTKNESYICFRRRDIKAIRKTRTAQVSSSDKLLRLKSELAQAFQLAENVLAREVNKREAQNEAKIVWEKRMALVDLKRRFPSLGSRDDDDFLFDKERAPPPPKRRPNEITLPGGRPRPKGDTSASPAPVEPMMRPKDRLAGLQQAMRIYLDKAKEADIGWDNIIDSPYQQLPIPYSDRHFKSLRAEATDERVRSSHSLRLRFGRGGRLHVDRRPSPTTLLLPKLETLQLGAKKLEKDRHYNDLLTREKVDIIAETRESMLEKDRLMKLRERWRFDTTGDVNGTDEEDRILFDDYDSKHVRYQSQLMSDQKPLLTDPRLYLWDHNIGSYNYINPQLLGPGPQRCRGDSCSQARPPPTPSTSQPGSLQQTAVTQPTPVAQPLHTNVPTLQSPVKIASPANAHHNRTPSTGPQRPPSSASSQAAPVQTSSPQTSSNSAVPANGVSNQSNTLNGNGTNTVSMTTPTLNVTNGIANVPLASTATNFVPQQVIQQKKQYHQSVRNHSAALSQVLMNGAQDVNLSTTNFANNPINPVSMAPKALPRQIPYPVSVQRAQSGQGIGDISGDAATLQNYQNQLRSMAMQNVQQFPLIQANTINGHSPARNAHSPPNTFTHAHSLSPHLNNGSPAQNHSQIPQSHMSPTRNLQTPVPPSPSPLLSHQLPNLVGNLSSQNQGF